MGVSFDRVASRYDETRGGQERAEQYAREIEPLLGASGATPVLELGVGTGIVASALRRRGRKVVGVDIAFEMLQIARSRIAGAAVRYDGLRLPFADATFDSVYAVWVLHLVPDQVAFLREVARVMKPKGRFIVAPTNRYPDDDVGQAMQPMFDALFRNQNRNDDPDRLAGVARQAGLVEVGRLAGHTYRQKTSGMREAERIESRESSITWRVSDSDWAAHVMPVVRRLRAMGEAEISRDLTHEILILQKAG